MSYEEMSEIELSAVVAEKIMCWQVLGPSSGPWTVHRGFAEYPLLDQDTWRPGASIADAKLVIDKMSWRGFWCRIHSPFYPGSDSHAGFTRHGQTGWNGKMDHCGQAPKIPRAICIAALRAVEGSEGEGS